MIIIFWFLSKSYHKILNKIGDCCATHLLLLLDLSAFITCSSCIQALIAHARLLFLRPKKSRTEGRVINSTQSYQFIKIYGGGQATNVSDCKTSQTTSCSHFQPGNCNFLIHLIDFHLYVKYSVNRKADFLRRSHQSNYGQKRKTAKK